MSDSIGNHWKSWLSSGTDGRLRVVIIVAAAFLFLNLHFIRADSGGEVVWSAQEAYIFISVVRRGVSVNMLAYPFVLLKESGGGIVRPNVELRYFTVIHVTPSKVEHYVFTILPGDGGPNSFTPIRGQIYANCPKLGGLCRWADDHFEATSQEERKTFHDTAGLRPDGNFANVGGWSKKGVAAGPANVFARSKVDAGDKFTIWEQSDPIGDTGYAAVSIYIQRGVQVPERIWYLDGHPRSLSWFEYLRSFQHP